MANILLQFPPPPRRSNLTVLEQEGLLKDVSESVPFSIPDYPEVVLQTDTVGRHSAKIESAQMAFLPRDQTVWKRALYSWYRNGVVSVLEEILDSKDEVPPWVSSTSNTVLNCLQKLITMKETLFPQMGLSNEDILTKYTHVSNWSKSPALSLAWHPHVTKLAVALRDDSIHVYSSGSSVNPVLKHKMQRQVADLAWQPLSSSVLAVACQKCVLIWHVEPTSLAVRPSTSTVQVLQHPGHSPVTSLAWCPDASHLVSASPRQTEILVWDVPREVHIPLKRGGGGGVALLRYSPDATKLFTATTSPLFRVWESKVWHSEVWSHLSGRCSAACWSPDGTVLIFAMEGESALYAVRYAEGVGSGHRDLSVVGTSVLLADVSSVKLVSASGEEIRAGGELKSIVWDKTGERLTVLFKPDELGNNNLVAVFKTTIHPVLKLLPGGFIKGKMGENAHHIAFQSNFSNGALLSVVWSSGRVSYIPMYFVPAKEIHQRGTPHLALLSPHHMKREIS